jgi:PAS domain S-box-containing protein
MPKSSDLGFHVWPPGGGRMGARIRFHDWSSTQLGDPDTWPTGLKVALRLLLNSQQPMLILWGPQKLEFWNDACLEAFGVDPFSTPLAAPGPLLWAGLWPVIGPQIESAMSGTDLGSGQTQLVPVVEPGHKAETWWAFSYSPIDDAAASSGIGGVLVTCSEGAPRVLAEWHFRLLAGALEQLPAAASEDEAIGILLSAARQLSGADAVALVERRDQGDCEYVAEEGPEPFFKGMRVPLATTVAGWALENGRTALVENVDTDRGLVRHYYEGTFVKSLIMVPLGALGGPADRAIGVYWSRPRSPEPGEVAHIEALARATGATLQHLSAEEQLRVSQTSLRESNDSLALALAAADIATWDLDRRTGVIRRSPRHDEMFGYAEPQPEWTIDIAKRHVLPEDWPLFDAAEESAWWTSEMRAEVRVRWPNGEIHWLLAVARTIDDDSGHPVRLAGIIQDITTRKDAEQRD